jgi:acid phosphatase type 7
VTPGSRIRCVSGLACAAGLALLLASCKASPVATPTQVVADIINPLTEETVTFVGAGDIGDCASTGPFETALLLDNIPGTIFTAGDNVQNIGSGGEYRNCFDPSWGRHLSRIRPSPGNHDYVTLLGGPYYAYFGENAGPADRGYYSYNLGSWHVVSLNSNIAVGASSTQVAWLRADLLANPAPCIVAYWHHPLFDASGGVSESKMKDIWRVLYEFNAEVVINGHLHAYSKTAPIDPDGRPSNHGIRQFIVGTGGATYDAVLGHWGVLKLTLRQRAFDWQFIPVKGWNFTDSGTATCVQ